MVLPYPANIIYITPPSDLPPTLTSNAPWISTILSDPTFRPITIGSRKRKATTEDSLMAETLSTDSTIRKFYTFYRHLPGFPKSTASANSSNKELTNSSVDIDTNPNNPLAGEAIALLYFGSGVNGHPHVLHGGITSTVFDEVMSLVAYLHHPPGTASYTAFLNVNFRKPLPTPGWALCRCWLEKKSAGRKCFVRGVMEDGMGGVFAEGESLFLEFEVSDKDGKGEKL